MATIVNSRGQITLPKAVRDHLGVVIGEAVDFELAPGGRVVLVKSAGKLRANRFESLRGSAGPGLSPDQIMALTRGED